MHYFGKSEENLDLSRIYSVVQLDGQMNTRQIHIFFKFSKVIGQFVWLFPCFVRVANSFVNLKLHLRYITLRIKTKNNFMFSSDILQSSEINIVVNQKFWRKYLSCIYLAVPLGFHELWELQKYEKLKILYVHTSKWIWDRSMFSSKFNSTSSKGDIFQKTL